MYEQSDFAIREQVKQNHAAAFQQIHEPGTWLSGAERVAVLREVRNARHCRLCAESKTALSPYAIQGEHDTVTDLSASMVEVVHRVVTDSGRLTEAWFKRVTSGDLDQNTYVEIVGLVATTMILDTFASGVGQALATPSEPDAGEPGRELNPAVFDGGAWLPMMNVEQEESGNGLPTYPNILRAMGLVPSAIQLFFPVMRTHYSLDHIDLEISRSQIELIASRISSHNTCFY